MRLFLTLFLSASGLAAMGKRPADLYLRAVEQYRLGEFEEAGAVFKALAPKDPRARQAWLAFLFERQGYGVLEMELSATAKSDSEKLLLARARADSGLWRNCLDAADGLPGLPAALLRAEALDALGASAAAEAYDAALAWPGRSPLAALAQYRAADFSQRQGAREEAEQRFKRSERLDQSFTSVHRRLAQLYAEGGRLRDAKARLERALKVDSLDAEARDCLNLLLKSQPSLLAEAKAKEAKRELERLALKNPRVQPMPRRDGEPLIRVGVLQNAASFKFKSGGELWAASLGLTLPAGVVFSVDAKKGSWRLRRIDSAGQSLVARLDGRPLALASLDPESTLSIFNVEFGSGYFWAGKEDRSFRGDFELRFDALKGATVINELPLDSYLLGVLPAEMPSNWPAQALLTQAVAARGDTLGKRGRHKDQGFDVCSDVHCAMYRGVGGESPASSKAVEATAGEVLEEQGRLLGGIYMNSCGGHTQDEWDTWVGIARGGSHAVLDAPEGPAFPLSPQDLLAYLDDREGQLDAWCAKAPGEPYAEYRWCARYSREELEQSVGRRHDVGRLLSVEPLERSEAGYVRRVRFSGSKGSSIGSSDFIRSAIKGLRSNLFYVETRREASGDPVEFLFHGGGWGHGVGLCQTGAASLAAAGKGHAEILGHYFKGAQIKRRY